jgi:hypothetical protein
VFEAGSKVLQAIEIVSKDMSNSRKNPILEIYEALELSQRAVYGDIAAIKTIILAPS